MSANDDRSPTDPPNPVVENIETILGMEYAALRQRTWADRLADGIAGFTGTIWFVALHLAWFGLWVLINTGSVPMITPFDRYPFQLLCMLVSLEAVLLATFVLIKQNRMGYLSDRRDHLDLQINLLTEREVTRLLRLTQQIADRLHLQRQHLDSELSKDTEVEGLMQTLDRKLQRDEPETESDSRRASTLSPRRP
jgi:uncharacterized membrane protein